MDRSAADPNGSTLDVGKSAIPSQRPSRRRFGLERLERRVHLAAVPFAEDPFGAVRADGNDLAIDSAGLLHRVWRDRDTHALRYATRTPLHAWTNPQTLDASPVGGQMSLALDPLTGRPAVAYYDRINGDLKYASKLSGTWNVSVLDQTGDVGDFPSLLITAQGKQVITYYDRTRGDLKWATQTAQGPWTPATIDAGFSGENVGAYSSVIEGPRRALMVAYADNTSGMLRLATLPNGATAWSLSIIDSGMPIGVTDISLLAGVGGVPLVAYRDAHFKRLKVAFQVSAISWQTWQLPIGDSGGYASLFLSNGTPYVLHNDRLSGLTEVVVAGDPTTRPARVVALGGEHLEAVTDPTGRLIFNRVDPSSGLLRTSATRFVHTPGTDPSERIIQWETIGGSTHDVSKRRVGWEIDRIGWQGYVNSRVAHLRSLGMRRHFMHNPFGTLPDEDFQFDQFIHAQDAGLNWLTTGFVQAWKPLIDSGMEVICYIGKLAHDPDFTSLTDLHAYMARVKRSIQPLIDAGCSIGLDSIVGNDVNSREYMVAEMLRQSGVKVYNENRPPRVYTHWHNFNGVYYDDGYILSQPHVNPDLHWGASNDLLTGEILRFTHNPPTGTTFLAPGWRGPAVMRILADGHTAATDYVALQAEGYTAQQLMNRAGELIREPTLVGAPPPPTGGAGAAAQVLDPSDGEVDPPGSAPIVP